MVTGYKEATSGQASNDARERARIEEMQARVERYLRTNGSQLRQQDLAPRERVICVQPVDGLGMTTAEEVAGPYRHGPDPFPFVHWVGSGLALAPEIEGDPVASIALYFWLIMQASSLALRQPKGQHLVNTTVCLPEAQLPEVLATLLTVYRVIPIDRFPGPPLLRNNYVDQDGVRRYAYTLVDLCAQ